MRYFLTALRLGSSSGLGFPWLRALSIPSGNRSVPDMGRIAAFHRAYFLFALHRSSAKATAPVAAGDRGRPGLMSCLGGKDTTISNSLMGAGFQLGDALALRAVRGRRGAGFGQRRNFQTAAERFHDGRVT